MHSLKQFLLHRGPQCKRLAALAFVATVCLRTLPVRAQDPLDDKGVDDVLEEIHQETASQWWNKDWKYRRKISIEDPKLLNGASEALFLSEPDPLLLYNTNRSQDNLADLRVIGKDGTVLPCGVTNFGRDDGTSLIWFAPNVRDFQKSLDVYVYYGNAAAKPTGDKVPQKGGPTGDPQFIHVGPEELLQGATSTAAAPGSFFAKTVPIEAERFEPESETGKTALKTQPAADASGENVLSVALGQGANAPTAWSQIKLPEGGTWYAHVRYKNGAGRNHYSPFQLLLGKEEIACGEGTSEAPYSWKSAKVELPQGDLKAGLRFSGPAVVDCVILTKDPHYRPDYRDINGPVWMRFKVNGNVASPYYVDLFGMHTTYSATGQQGNTAAYLFKDQLVYPRKIQWETEKGTIRDSDLPPYAANLPKDPKNLISGNEWTPWGKALAKGSYTWYSDIRFISGGKTPQALSNLNVDYEFATRPDSSRTYRAGEEPSGSSSSIMVHMPTALDYATLKNMTLTFGDWGEQRFEIAKALGFKEGEGPKKIVFSTMASAYSEHDAENILKTIGWIGLNTITLYNRNGSVDPALREKYGLNGVWEFARTQYMFFNHFYTPDKTLDRRGPTGTVIPGMRPIDKPFPGMTYGQTIEKILDDVTDADYKARAAAMKKNTPWEFAHIRYNDLDDEIGAAIDGHTINKHPLFKGYFVEYLKAHELEPGFFGAKTWDDVKAVDYSPELSKKEAEDKQIEEDRTAAEKKQERDTDLVGGPDDNDKSLEDLLGDEPAKTDSKDKKTGKKAQPKKSEKPEEDIAEEEGRKAHERLTPEQEAQQKVFEKRAFYWTQKFRSHFTALFYHYHAKVVTKYFPAGTHTCANLQAMPAQAGRMWDGSLNIFDLGREEGFTALQLEDWTGSERNVRFAMDLMHAAARKKGQETTALVVGGNPGKRIIADLMEGTRNFLFYLYGPIYAIGPVWAEDKGTQFDIGDAMRKVGRTEADIVASKRRQHDVAILVANSSETNAAYFQYPFDRERMAIYSALADAQVPVEVVGEEEITEDDALKNYRVLYVCDPHVTARAQEKIKAWVAAGGTLWVDYAGLARQEYDQPSHTMDEVFGLQSRGDIQPYPAGGANTAKVPGGDAVKVPKSEYFEADEIKGVLLKADPPTYSGHYTVPDYKVSTGKVLGTFDDGKPAIVYNKFGKGQAILEGFLAGLSYTGHGSNYTAASHTAASTSARGQMMTIAAKLAQIKPDVKIDEHGFLSEVHDGPEQSVVFLINGPSDLNGVPMEVSLPKPPKSAYAGSGKPVEYKADGNHATVNLKMSKNDTDIIVFKY
jgi:hypothetical protein